MELERVDNKIIFKKKINALDELVVSFTDILDSLKIDYVIVSGYVAIVFGRSRATEDIDILIEHISKEKFSELYADIAKKGWWIINTGEVDDAFDMLRENYAIRVAKAKKVIPNFEVKFIKDHVDKYSIENKISVDIGIKTFLMSPIEMQIAYKCYLGSEKDIEDAYFLFSLFEKILDASELRELIGLLRAENNAKRYLRGLYDCKTQD